MVRWMLLLRVHNAIWLDTGWSLRVRHDACKVIKRCMIELGELQPLAPSEPVQKVPPLHLRAGK